MYETEKQAFHFAKLALFNVRLLWDIEQARSREDVIHRLVSDRIREDSIGEPVSLLHQATFLQFAYISLVWLWERGEKAEVQHEVVKHLSGLFNFDKAVKLYGPRPLNGPRDILRLLRNAISHGHVVATESAFIFRDIGRGEDEFSAVRLSWVDLGDLSECMLAAWNRVLWPELNGPADVH